MATQKIAISVNRELIRKIDAMVKEKIFPNRSKAIQAAIEFKLENLLKYRLSNECAKLDKAYEQALAEEGMEIEEWPEY